MGRVSLYIAASIDGFIAGPQGELDWLPAPRSTEDYGYADFLAGIDVLVMGRKTYDVACSFGEWPYVGRRTWVLSRRPPPARPDGVEFAAGDTARILEHARAEARRGVWLVGGADVAQVCWRERLIDELILTVVPVAIGGGVRLFGPHEAVMPLELQSTRAFPDGLVQLTYSCGRR